MDSPTIKLESDDVNDALDRPISLKPVSISRRRSGWFAWLLSVTARLAIWSCLYIIIFRCPSSIDELSSSSSRICRPYLEARAHVRPYIQPYYDSYAAPYVASVWPYVETLNAKAIAPAVEYGSKSYDRYAAPRVAQVQGAAQKQWDQTVRPQLDGARLKAQSQYDRSLAPVVNQAAEVAEPYYTNVKQVVSEQYRSKAIPAYEKSLPYARQAFEQIRHVTISIIFPYARYGTDLTVHFVTRNLWPRIRILYGEKVEPQLLKIRERLADYRDAKSIEAVLDDIDRQHSSTSSESLASSSSVFVSTTSTDVDSHPASSITTSETATSFEESEPTKDAHRQISEDLKIWQEKFAKAADKGAEDLRERVSKITSQQIESQVQGVGDSLVIQLEESVARALEGVKNAVRSVVKDLPEDSTDDDNESAVAYIRIAIRTAGKSIKEKAQEIRSWKIKYHHDTSNLIQSAKESTLDVIDHIRDLGLQEIGIRWASMDDVTYQDWSEYHKLKKTFDEWRVTVENVALNHEGPAQAKNDGEEVESRGMAIAEDAATELARLRDVAIWKVDAKDASDDFSSKILPAKAVNAGKKVLDKISSAGAAVVGEKSSQDPVDAVLSAASDHGTGMLSSASSIAAEIVSSMQSGSGHMSSTFYTNAEEASSSISSIAPSVASSASSASSLFSTTLEEASLSVSSIVPTMASSASSKIEELSSTLSSRASSASSEVTDSAHIVSHSAGSAIPVVHDPTSSTISAPKAHVSPSIPSQMSESVVSAAKEKMDSVTEAIKGTPPPPIPDSKISETSSTLARANYVEEKLSNIVKSASSAATEVDEVKLAWSRSIMSLVASRRSESEASATQEATTTSSTLLDSQDTVREDPKLTQSGKLQSILEDAGGRVEEMTSSLAEAAESYPQSTPYDTEDL